MIRATRRLLFHRNSNSSILRRAHTTIRPVVSLAAAASIDCHEKMNDATIVLGATSLAASIAAIGSLSTDDRSPSSVVKCDADVMSLPLSTQPCLNVSDVFDEKNDNAEIQFRTIPFKELLPNEEDAGKSSRALALALEHDLFTEDILVDKSADLSAQEDCNNLLATSIDTPTNEIDMTNNSQSKKDSLRRLKTISHDYFEENQVYTKKMYFYRQAAVKDSVLKKFRLFALPSSEKLGKEMAYLLGTDLNCVDVGSYTDGETSVQVAETIRGKNVFVVCSTISTTAIMELLLTISALRRGSAKRICVVIPFYGYSRQDRRTGMKREPIAAADMAKLLEEMGIDSVICVDLHNPLLKGFFSPTIPVDHLVPGPVAAAYFYEQLYCTTTAERAGEKKKCINEETSIRNTEIPKVTIVAAHENQVYRANLFRNALQKLSGNDDIRVALISTSRALQAHNMPESATIVGDVNGRQCIIVDDIINTGTTMIKAINVLNKAGASEVYGWATHGVLHMPENDIDQKLQEIDGLKYLLISNSVAIDKKLPPKIRKLSIAPLLSEAVARALHNESISSILNVEVNISEK